MGTWITIEPDWRNENIERKSMPIIGRATCNKIMWKPLLGCLLYTSPSPRDDISSRMPSSA